MTSLNVPNDIVDGALVEAIDHQQNYQEIETHVNGHLINKDASVAMVGQLLLASAATAPLGATTKAQMATADAASVSTAATDATTKADAAVVTANAYTDVEKVELAYVKDDEGAAALVTATIDQTFLDTGVLANTKAGHYIVAATVDVTLSNVSSPGSFVATLFVAGNPEGATMVWLPNGLHLGERVTLSNTWIIPVDASSSQDFQIKVRQIGATGSYTCDGLNHSFVTALFVG